MNIKARFALRVFAISITGFVDSNGQIQQLYGVYLVSAQNMGAGQKIGDYEDLSFLAPQYFDEFTQKLRDLNLTDADRERIKQARELEIDVRRVNLFFNHYLITKRLPN